MKILEPHQTVKKKFLIKQLNHARKLYSSPQTTPHERRHSSKGLPDMSPCGTDNKKKIANNRLILNLLDAPPIYANFYRDGPLQRDLYREKIDHKLNAGKAKAAETKWALSVTFVSNKNIRLRFCVDYRRGHLDAVTERRSCWIARMDKCMNPVGITKVFSTLNTNKVY